MKTLEEISNDYAIEKGFESWDEMCTHMRGSYLSHHFEEVSSRFEIEVAKETLKNATENAKTILRKHFDADNSVDENAIIRAMEEYRNQDAEMYKECLENFVPNDKWDEATKFLSTYGSGLAKDMANKGY